MDITGSVARSTIRTSAWEASRTPVPKLFLSATPDRRLTAFGGNIALHLARLFASCYKSCIELPARETFLGF